MQPPAAALTTSLTPARFKHVARIERLNWPPPFKFDPVAATVGFPGLEPKVPATDRKFMWFLATRAARASAVVGYLVLDADPAQRTIYLNDVGVDPAHAGRGVGTRLMEAAVRAVAADAALRAKPMVLKVDPANAGAIRLYERFGFRRTRARRDDGLGTQLVMRRPAAAA